MDAARYKGYLAASNTVAVERLEPAAADVVRDLAEGLLLARDAGEADAARDRVPQALASLVDEGDLTRRAADRCWALMKACGPPMPWPSSWHHSHARSPGSAVRGR
jgi:hypothetical protein